MNITEYYEQERKLQSYEIRRKQLLEEYANFPEKRIGIALQLGALRNAKTILLKKRE